MNAKIVKTLKGCGAAVAVGAMLTVVPFVQKWEGFREEAYLDPVGIPTICYGHTQGVTLGDFMTEEECAELLTIELSEFMRAVETVRPDMPDHMKAAFASFAYNVGVTAFRNSTAARKLREGDFVGACNELPRWVYAGGRRLKGLENRRKAERELCLNGY